MNISQCPKCKEVKEFTFLKSSQQLYCEKCLHAFDPHEQVNRLGYYAELIHEIEIYGTCHSRGIPKGNYYKVLNHHKSMYKQVQEEIEKEEIAITAYREKVKGLEHVDDKDVLCPECLRHDHLYTDGRSGFFCAFCETRTDGEDIVTVSKYNPTCHRCGKNLTVESWTYDRYGEDHRTGIWCAVCKAPAEMSDDDIPF